MAWSGCSARDSLPPMPDLGVEQIWAHAQDTLAGKAGRRSSSDVELDHSVLHVLGVGREAANRFLLRSGVTLADFERWIEEQNGGSIAPWRIARAREITGAAGRDP